MRKFKDHQFARQVVGAENPLASVLVSVNRTINKTITQNETHLVTVLHCSIYLALKYLEKLWFPMRTASY